MSCGEAPPSAPPPGDAGPVAVATLPADDAQDTAEPVAITVPAGSAQVRFELRGLDRPAVDLMAEFESVATGEMRRWPVDEAPAADGHAVLAVTVPVYAVPPGEHRLTLWVGDAEAVRRYALQIVTP